MMPEMGLAADTLMAQIESARGWPLYKAGVAPRSPADFGVPLLEDFRWPPHERAARARPWPEKLR